MVDEIFRSEPIHNAFKKGNEMNKKYLLFLSAVILSMFIIFGTYLLAQADEKQPSTNSLEKLEERIISFSHSPKYRDDKAAVIALKEAVAAAREGNYGIGSCLIHEATGTVIQCGHNRVFRPYFPERLACGNGYAHQV